MTGSLSQDPAFLQPHVFEYVLRSTSDGIVVMNVEGLIDQVNPAAARMLGVTPENVIGRSPNRAFQNNPALLNLFNREGDQALDVRLPRRRLASGLASSLDTGERVILLHDVTESRDLDSRREALVRAIAHDLRNPISALTGFAELVEKFGELNEQQKKFLTRILQTTGKLHDVLATLVDLAWIEAGMPMEHLPIQLRDVINLEVERLAPLAHKHDIVIAVAVQNPMPIVMGDRTRLGQVIYQLLHNAILYSSPEQSIAIHGWGDSSEVYCSVADQGMGISDDELGLIFDRMYRGRDEVVRSKPGGGLGLTIARTIVERHGGDIWASSNLGEGSTFTFVLPTVELTS